jgi:hypothetical protein
VKAPNQKVEPNRLTALPLSTLCAVRSGDGEDHGGGEYLYAGYGFFLFFLSLAIGFGMKNHQPSTIIPIVQPAMMIQLPSGAISI